MLPHACCPQHSPPVELTDTELGDLVDRTVAEIRRTVGTKRAAFAWTGCRGSLALEYLAGLAGIRECVLTVTELEYPAYLRWATDRMPGGLTTLSTGEDVSWLDQHPRMLFPRDRTAWSVVRQRGYQRYCTDQGNDFLLLSGRRAGGYTYGPGRALTWRDRSGLTRFTPLAIWPAQAINAVIAREQIPVPPCYGWPRADDPRPWPARRAGSSCAGFREVWEIDPDIIRGAAQRLPSARRWLQTSGLC